MKCALFLSLLIGMLFSPAGLHAAEIRGYTFPEDYTFQDHHLKLHGLALKNKLFFEIYVAGFYLEKDVDVHNVMENVAKRVEIVYLRDLTTENFIESLKADLREVLTARQYEMIAGKIDEMAVSFWDIKAGDRFAFTFLPGEDMMTIVERNGRIIEEIQGDGFARTLFSAWIGHRPVNRHIKRQLLGLR